MGYKIEYGPKRKTKNRSEKWRFALMTGFFFLLFALFAHFAFADALQMLRHQLLPTEKINTLIQELRKGSPAREAIAAFCEELFYAR